MDAVFIALFFFFTVVGFATYYLQRGIGNMAEPMRQFGLFLLNLSSLVYSNRAAVRRFLEQGRARQAA